MANLRVDKITSTETFERTGSVQFDGDGDYLSVADHADLEFGSGDFTVECFIYPTGVPQGTWACIFSKGFPLQSYFMNTNSISLYASTTASGSYTMIENANITGTNSVPRDRWTHYAVCRSGDIWKVFIDGIEKYSALHPGTIADTGSSFGIGDYAPTPGTYEFQGHISNFRILKGKALYTENFKPPMRELEVTPETVLLACQSKTDATLEKTGKTITVTGNAVASELTPGILTPVPKAGAGSAITGSIEFSGTNDYLSVQSSTDFDFGTGDFTIELYANLGNLTSRNIFARNDSNPSNTGILLWQNGSSQLQWYSSVGNNTGVITVTTPLTLHEWAHIAVSRKSNTTRLFANGVLIGSTSDNTDISGDSVLNIGSTFAGTLYYVKGFISNLRMVKGTALYTDDFIPPTRELKKVPGTVLLCCQDPDNPLTEATGKTITPYGNLGDGSLGPELVTNNNVWTLTKGGSGATDWTVSNNGRSLAGTTVTSGYIRATYTLSKGDYLVSLRWTGGAFAVQDSTGYIVATDGSSTAFGASDDGAYSFYMTDTTSVVITGTTWNQAYTVDDISIKRIYKNNGGSNFTPQVGDDRKVTFEGVTKVNSDAYFYLPTGDTITRDSRSGRGLIAGGYTGSEVNNIEYVTIASSGNAQDFGDLTVARRDGAGCASATRGLVFAGGFSNNRNVIDYVEISTTSNAIDFGDTTENSAFLGAALSNSTRGVFAGGIKTSSPIRVNPEMQYVTIASRGNTLEFGELSVTRYAMQGAGSPTRGMFFGGAPAPAPAALTNTIDYITIAATGNAVDFGDISVADRNAMVCSNSIRSVIAGGQEPSAHQDRIEYVTNASTGNAQDFGNLIVSRSRGSAASSQTRGLIFGGYSPSDVNTIDYVTFATTGNASDFGDTTQAIRDQAGFSDSHGGLG